MRFDILTLFPAMFESFLRESLIGKALEKGAFEAHVTDIRDYATDRHRTADDRPFGGGAGMVLKPEPIVSAVESVRTNTLDRSRARVILLAPSGWPLTQAKVEELAGLDQLVLICGRYEGVDQRVSELVVDEELSIGDYVLQGGEVGAMVIIEAVARLLPGVLGKQESVEEETFQGGLLEYPHYTRPREFRGLEVPETLLGGDHAAIAKWRLTESLRRTLRRRPDILNRNDLPDAAKAVLAELDREENQG